jgi:hypothetical protein
VRVLPNKGIGSVCGVFRLGAASGAILMTLMFKALSAKRKSQTLASSQK